MPLTDFQRRVLAVLAPGRDAAGYLAGGAALHFSPNSARYSHDLDFFHDSSERVATAFAKDGKVLEEAGFVLELVFSQPGFIRAIVSRDDAATQIDWAHDSAWRFMPLVRDELGGFLLHPVDLAANKALALAGRDEARDFVDILYIHKHILRLGPLVWAAVGKDPGFSPESLLEQMKRSGRFRPEDFARLDLARPFDLQEARPRWRAALAEAEAFVGHRPAEEVGCLYYSSERSRFEEPSPGLDLESQGLVTHFGRPGGVLPRATDSQPAEEE
ncbi:MAG: nucleotidyl transferase AbiEii/AbiGii toxin family protein [Chloroflexi bacterium]|nr:nucleotidyl transferase AbiEii/AbiGii toxin family protein [Chloroflexota bacterium]